MAAAQRSVASGSAVAAAGPSAPPKMPRPAAPSSAWLMRVAVAAVLAMFLLALGTFSAARRAATIDDAYADLAVANQLLAEQLAVTLTSIDSVLTLTSERVASMGLLGPLARPLAEELLSRAAAGVPQVRRIYVTDEHGVVTATRRPDDTGPSSIGDRAFFAALRDKPAVQVVISAPRVESTEGEPLIQIARRLSGPDGVFAGIVAIAVPRTSLERIYDAGARWPSFAGRVFRDDLTLLAARPTDPAAVGRIFAALPDAEDVTQRRIEHKQFEGRSVIDGTLRLFDVRWVPGWPLLSSISTSLDDALARWRQEVLVFGGAALVFAALVFGLVWWLTRELGRRAAAASAELRAREAERLMAVAQAAAMDKSRVLAGASHDLRQPLHAIGLFAAALARRASDAEQAEIAGNIQRASRSMARMFDSLLDVAKLEAGIRKPSFATVPLGPLFAQLAHEMRAELHQRPIALRVVVPAGLAVTSDPSLLETLLRNLVANAMRYTRRGRILLGCRRRGQDVEIQVWDTGTGIAEGERSRIFDPFVQIDRPEATSGAGLGLSIVRELAGRLGHRIDVTSREARGSCFSITLARAEAPATVGPAAPDEAGRVAAAAPRVVLLDDDHAVENATALALRDAGFRVERQRSAAALHAALLADEAAVALIDLELGEPGAPGTLDALELLADWEAAARRHLPAVIVTASGQVATHRRLRASGRTWLTKPCDREALAGAILLEQARAQPSSATSDTSA